MEGESLSTLSASRQFQHDLGILPEDPHAPAVDSTTSQSTTTSHEGSLMNRLKRTASLVKHHLPFTNSSASGSTDSSVAHGAPPSSGPRAWSIAPVTHRENSAKRALYDSMPSLPSIPSIESLLSHPFLTSYNSSTPPSSATPKRKSKSKGRRSYFASSHCSNSRSTPPAAVVPIRSRSNPVSPHESDDSDPDNDLEEEDDDEDDSPPATPPIFERRSRSNSLAHGQDVGSASTSSDSTKDALASLHGNVLMLGGFRGSVLRDPVADQRLWIPLKVPAGIRKVTLALGLTEEDESRSREKIVGTKMLTHVGPLDMGKTLKHTLTSISHSQKLAARGPRLSIPFVPNSVVQHVHHATSSPSSNGPSSSSSANGLSQPDPSLLNPRLRVESWGYDFRLKLQTPSRELVERLTVLKKESKARGEGIDGQGIGAVVICHSMGGLVVLHALSQAPDPTIFRGIVFAGSPFQGCVNVLGPLGLDQGFRRNPGVGSPNVVFSWRSVFYFLPRGTPYSDGALEEGHDGDGVDKRMHSTNGTTPTSTAAASAEPQEIASPVPSVSSWTSPSTWTSPFTSTTSSTYFSSTATTTSSELGSSAESATPTWQSHTKPPLSALFHGCFEDHSGRPIPLNFHDPVTWSRYCLSPLTAGLFGPTITGETVDRKAIHREHRRKDKAKKDGSHEIDLGLPLPGAPGTLGDPNTISRNGMVGRAVEAGQDAVDQLEGDHNDDGNEQEEQLEEDEVVKKYLETSLEAALEFWDQIDNGFDESKSHLYPPVSVLTNSKIPTVRGVQVKSRKTIPSEKYDSLLYAEGDGIVTYDSARTLPGRWAQQLRGVVETSHGHVAMLSDVSSVRKAVALLNLS